MEDQDNSVDKNEAMSKVFENPLVSRNFEFSVYY